MNGGKDTRSTSQDDQAPPSDDRKKHRRRRRLLAVGLGLLPFVLLEAGLRLFGIGADPTDLHAGFGQVSPLFTADETTQQYRTSLVKEEFFVTQEFPVKKPENEFRIFCLGGSTVQGRPYRPETAFGKWLELELNAVDPSHHHRVVNCGGVSYASYRLRPVLEEVLNHSPDLIILATGHNEFLEDRTYASVKSRSGFRIRIENAARSIRTVMVLRQLLGGAPRREPAAGSSADATDVRTRLDDDSGYAGYHRDDNRHDQVYAQFRDSVSAMLTMCADADIPVVLVRLGTNLRDCPPFKSENLSELTSDEQQQWQALFDEATQVGKTDPQQALKIYEQALNTDDRHPLLHFRMARCYDRLQQFAKAEQHYRKARDEDICPLRMTDQISRDIAGLAESHDVPLVDAAATVESASPDGIPGYESYIDHVHPTIGVHQTIARAVADQLTSRRLIRVSRTLTAKQRRRIFREHIRSLGPVYFSNGRRRIGWLEGWARRQRLYEETVPVDARGYTASAVRNLDLHDFDTAAENVSAALETDPQAADILLDYSALLFGQGRDRATEWILGRLAEHRTKLKQPADLDLARLIIAFESENAAGILEALKTQQNTWPSVLQNASQAWTAVMPDIADRIKEAEQGRFPPAAHQ